MDVSVENYEVNQERLKHEYEFGIGYLYRWEMYNFAESGFRFHNESIDRMQLTGNEDILDIGCGQGELLKTIEARGHHGHLVGIDNNNSLEYTRRNTQVVLLDGDVSDCLRPEYGGPTAFPDDTFDIASAF